MLSSADIWFDQWGAPKTPKTRRIASYPLHPSRAMEEQIKERISRDHPLQTSAICWMITYDHYIYLRLTDESWLKKPSAMVIWYCIISCVISDIMSMVSMYQIVSVSMVTPPIQLSFRISLQPAEELAKRLAEGIPDQLGTGTFHFFNLHL